MAATALRALLVAVIVAATTGVDARTAKEPSIFRADVVKRVNEDKAATWTAGYNPRVHDLTRAELRSLVGTYRHPPANALPVKRADAAAASNAALPLHFDARQQWPHCPSLSFIRDQGHCGSCWAFASVESLSDRFCVALNESVQLSTNDLLACCGEQCGNGCNGGWPYRAWQFFMQQGVVTEQCEPYFDQDGCRHPGCSPVRPTPACQLGCTDGADWAHSKHFAADAYMVGGDDDTVGRDAETAGGSKVRAMMAELLARGPYVVDFDVYEDFTYYRSGVYSHVTGEAVGGHAVKLMGWGTDDSGTDYWLIANSWNRSWGEDGFFRIRRGTNECGIEQYPTAGTPSATPHPAPDRRIDAARSALSGAADK